MFPVNDDVAIVAELVAKRVPMVAPVVDETLNLFDVPVNEVVLENVAVPVTVIVDVEKKLPIVSPVPEATLNNDPSLAFHVAAEAIRPSAKVPIHVGIKVIADVDVVIFKPMLVSELVANINVVVAHPLIELEIPKEDVAIQSVLVPVELSIIPLVPDAFVESRSNPFKKRVEVENRFPNVSDVPEARPKFNCPLKVFVPENTLVVDVENPVDITLPDTIIG